MKQDLIKYEGELNLLNSTLLERNKELNDLNETNNKLKSENINLSQEIQRIMTDFQKLETDKNQFEKSRDNFVKSIALNKGNKYCNSLTICKNISFSGSSNKEHKRIYIFCTFLS